MESTTLKLDQRSSSMIDVLASYEAHSRSGGKYSIIRDNNLWEAVPVYHVAKKCGSLFSTFLDTKMCETERLTLANDIRATLSAGHITAANQSFQCTYLHATLNYDMAIDIHNKLELAISGLNRLTKDEEICTLSERESLERVENRCLEFLAQPLEEAETYAIE